MSLTDETNRTPLRGVASRTVAVRTIGPKGIILVLDQFEVPAKPGLPNRREAETQRTRQP